MLHRGSFELLRGTHEEYYLLLQFFFLQKNANKVVLRTDKMQHHVPSIIQKYVIVLPCDGR